MKWGRKQTRIRTAEKRSTMSGHGGEDTTRWNAARAVCILGAFSCLLFLCIFMGGQRREVSFPKPVAEAAAATFLSEHASFSDALGISEYFPLPAVSVGSFSGRGEEAYRAFVRETESPWTFREYLKEALRTLMGLS